jgi:phosphatidylserine/phosphatidylglycerophosphate/cardiolipin synthase-like enzyme
MVPRTESPEVIPPAQGASAASVAPTVDGRSLSAPESVALLNGGKQAYPRMLLAIARVQRSVYLEVYAFASSEVGARFVEALGQAARWGDGAGSNSQTK